LRNTPEIDRTYLASVVQEPNKVTLIGGIHRSYSNRVFQTTNGTEWAEQLPMSFTPPLLASATSFNGYLWIVGGARNETLDTNEVWRSADGVNWTRVVTTGAIFSPRSSHRVVAFNNRLWVIGGLDYFTTEGSTPNFNNEVWSSADGVSWTQHPNPGFAARASHEAVVLNGRLWIIAGSIASGVVNDVWSTADGQAWTSETASAAFSARYGHKVVALNNQLYLLGGGTGAGGGTDEVWRSADGRTWIQLPGTRFASRIEHGATVLGGRMYVVAGATTSDYFGATAYNDVWSSSDGVTWTNDLAAARFSARRALLLTTHNNEMYVIGGYGAGRPNDLWKSGDGVNWRAAFSYDITAP